MVDFMERLQKPLDPKLVKKRKQAGRDVSYLEGHTVISQANDIFGFDGWSYEYSDLAQVADSKDRPIWTVKVRVSALGVQRSDIGIGIAANGSPDAQETAIKGAVTDGLKRALRSFGSQFGNDLYDKDGGLVEAAIAMGATPVGEICEEHGMVWVNNPKTGKRGHPLPDDPKQYHVQEIL